MIHRDAGSIHVLGLDNIANEEPVKNNSAWCSTSATCMNSGKSRTLDVLSAPLYPSWDGGCYHKYLDTFGLGGAQNGKKHIKDLSAACR